MSDLYSNDKVREHAEHLVRNEIYVCLSYLISQIARPDGGVDPYTICKGLGIDYEEDLLRLLEIEDFEAAADYHIDNMDVYELREYLRDNDVEFVEPESDGDGDEIESSGTQIDDLRKMVREHVEAEGYQDFCNDNNIDPERTEVYEHWACSNWFASKLEAKGHPIARDFLGMTIWGRPTTGQAISMDGVILEVARDCLES